ncbi:leucine-rich repeat protein 1-like [Mercurialis annua]|uniref:leucine-rich repeat protein 1-like n=1 Tax=Mercurialis annua TaxID=3986 RepID=UPI00216043FB|nr:leucine-rich repeat protein 1-like [Mercurialis annua]
MTSNMSYMIMLCVAVILTLVPAGYGNAESDALLVLKGSLTDPNGLLNNWDPSSLDPCLWFHVTCNAQKQVTQLLLPGANLGGRLVPNLQALQNLDTLVIFNNRLTGPIPAEIATIPTLRAVDFSNNDFCGSISPGFDRLLIKRFDNNPRLGRPC